MATNFKMLAVGASVIALMASGTSYAQEQPEEAVGIEEIIVTAQKRDENLQKTAVAVTMLSGESLVSGGVTDLRAVQNVTPGARFQQQGATTQVFLRGVGSNLDFGNVEPVVAFNMNGIYTPREGTSQPLYDLERIEILPGPQGTLYGRNALGGTVNVHFKRPTQELETIGMIEAGNYNMVHGTLVQNLPLSDTLAVRAAVDYHYRDGYMTSGAYSKNDFGARLGILYEPSSDISIYLWGQYAKRAGSPSNLVNKGTDPATGASGPQFQDAFLTENPWDDQRSGSWATGVPSPPGCSFIPFVFGSCLPFGQPVAEKQKYNLWTFGGQIDIGIADGITLTYIPGYFSLDSQSKYWLGILPADKTDNYRLTTHELRLAGDSDRLKWLIGAYGYSQKTVGDFVVAFVNVSSRVLNHRVKGIAVFGEATYSISDSLRVTLGGRGSFDKRRANGISLLDATTPYTFDKSFSRFDYKAGVEVDLSDRAMAYLTYQTGYQPGTFNEIPNTPTQSNLINSPKLSSVVGGVKTRFLDNRLQLNLEAYYYSFNDLLIQAYNAQVNYNEIFNAKTRSYGFQLDAVFQPTNDDRFSLSVSYLNARIQQFSKTTANGVPLSQYEGFVPPYAAPWTVNVAYHHDFQMKNGYLRAAADARYEGEWWADFVHTLGVRQKPNWKANAALTYFSENDKWSAGLWIKNITNEPVLAATAAAGLPGPATAYLEEPRTFGGRVTFKF
jgi:iron complex outermembrane receptor protein